MFKNFFKLCIFSVKEIRAQLKIQGFLIFNLSFGIFGFLLLQIFQQSLVMQTKSKAQETMAGDLSISARRIFSDKEISTFEAEFKYVQRSETKSFFAMIANGQKSRLVQVIAIDEAYPLYGSYEFQNKSSFSNQKKIWIDKNLKIPLNLTKQTQIKLGQTEFEIADTIIQDPTRSFKPGGFAPVVYIPLKYLADTQLMQIGSTVSHQFLYKMRSPAESQTAQKKLSSQIKDTTIKFETAAQDSEGGNQVLKYFTDYLGLVSLVALGLCFLCGGYLLRWAFIDQKKNIAIYKTLGLQNSEVIQIQIIKNTLISMLSFLLSTALTVVCLPFVQTQILKFNLPIQLGFNFQSFWITLLISICVPQLISMPLMIEMVQLSPKDLFQAQIAETKKNKLFWVWLFFSVFLFWLVTVFQSQSLQTGSVFTLGLIGLFFIFKFLLSLVFKILDFFILKFSWLNRYAMLGLIRKKQSTDLVFITMSLAILVLCLLPHIKSSILEEIKPSTSSKIPKLFLFDIQPEQVQSLTEITKSKINQTLEFTPMVRSRILKLNDENYERFDSSGQFQTREQEEDARFRNRGVNLTYKLKLQDSERVTEGRWNESVFVPNDDPAHLPEVSLEEKYAGRIKAKINDIMTFDVQGLQIKAKVTSFRQVRWTSFQPNFFIVFQSGILEDAPQIFLSSVSNIKTEDIDSYQSAIVEKLSNVSIINLQQTVESSLVFIDQMAFALQAMAYLSMVVGLFVFIILLSTQIRDRLTEMNLIQILGLPNDDVIKIVRRQFSVLIILALASGILLSLVASTLLMKFIFKIGVTFDLAAMIRLCVIIIPISFLGIYWGLRPLKKLTPNDLIRNG